MRALFERFANLSLFGKVLVLGLIVGVIAALLVVFAGSVAVWVVLAGVLLVIVLIMLYQAVLTAMSRKKAAPFQKALAGIGAMTPMGVTEPAKRARLDDLRRVFESGVEKFRAAGKNLYALPWYLVVGEPGSGKTEAIRHCNVGFPPGLQDELQGSGGTLNMNWWFTNHAVLLDTAGRLMFEEVEPGSTSEWQEFLKLLKKFRPACPVNGLLLVIPAESLIKDTADKIEKKASRIARQLDTVQRSLGVRFPVFVVITKADLINGFREFFDSVQDPALQHQMLGWSNPGSLDEPFKPEAVDDHLAVVQRRLARRRMGLLLDPVNTDNPRARRTDQVDALYAFPEAISSIAPRLRQYLSMIFVQGEWSAKPLFLRGIYFTSSMREGSALDADLAAALGVPVDQLPEGRVWERDRAFFLRDLFMGKVFRERGLVTSGGSTSRLRRGRAAIIASVGLLGLGALAGLTWFGSTALRQAVVQPLTFWSEVSRAYTSGAAPVEPSLGSGGQSKHLLPIVQKLLPADESYLYRGDAGEDAAGLTKVAGIAPEAARRAMFPGALRDAAAETINVPVIFKPVAAFTGDASGNLLYPERIGAAKAIARASISSPLLDAARTRIATDADDLQPDWNDQATAALIELLHAHGAAGAKGESVVPVVNAEPLLRYALADTDSYVRENVAADLATLQSLQDWAIAPVTEGAPTQAGSLLRSRDADLIRYGARAFIQLWQDRAEGKAAVGSGGVGALVSALQDFGTAETKLLASGASSGGVPADWAEQYKQIESAHARAAAALSGLSGSGKSLPELLKAERAGMTARMNDQFAQMKQALKGASAETQAFDQLAGELDRALPNLQQLATQERAAPESLTRISATDLGNGPTPLFEQRMAVYSALNTRLTLTMSAGDAAGSDTKNSVQARADAVKIATDALAPLEARNAQTSADVASTDRALQVFARNALRAADDRDRSGIVSQHLRSAPQTAGAVASLVAEIATKSGTPGGNGTPRRPKLPLAVVAEEFDPRYDPTAMPQALASYVEMWELRTQLGAAQPPQGLDAALGAADQYLMQYADYWTRRVVRDAAPDAALPWSSLHSALTSNAQVWKYTGPVGDLSKRIAEACKRPLSAFGAERLPLAMRQALEKTLREAEDGQSTLSNASFERATEAMLGNWRSLGADPVTALATLKSRLGTPSGPTEYFAVTISPTDTPDFAQVYWRNVSLQLLSTLRREAGNGAQSGKAFDAALEFLRFPLAESKAGELPLSPIDVLGAGAAINTAAQAVTGSQAGAAQGPTGDAEINAQVAALQSGSQVSAIDAQRLQRAARMLSIPLPNTKQPGTCKISVVWNGPLAPGEESLTPILSSSAGSGQASMVAGPVTPLATVAWPMSAEALSSSTITPFVAFAPGADLRILWQSPRVQPTVIAAPWGVLELLSDASARPVGGEGGRRTWEVKVPVMLKDDRASVRAPKAWVWLRLEFDRELPPKDEWPGPRTGP